MVEVSLKSGQENNVSGAFNNIKTYIGLTRRLLHDDVKRAVRLLRKYIQYAVHGPLQFGVKLRKLALTADEFSKSLH